MHKRESHRKIPKKAKRGRCLAILVCQSDQIKVGDGRDQTVNEQKCPFLARII